ncbi:MAG: hypothetical protein D6729_07200 [Deltaproteobacteria bacterium]|nr:MAG: hypothetical protein D6729_07200 [Deltaproteobacteria bacterium]
MDACPPLTRFSFALSLTAILLAAAPPAQAAPARSAPPAGVRKGAGTRKVLTRLWLRHLPVAGIGSPVAYDFDGDGQREIVLVGGKMGRWGAAGVVAQRDGRLLWKHRFSDEQYVTPAILTVPGQTLLVTGGRDQRLHALDGKTGEEVWTLSRPGGINFNALLVVPDADGDGVRDLLATRGGGYDDARRIPGEILRISGRNGTVLTAVEVPDGREIYSAPARLPEGDLLVATGSLRIPGHLFRLDARHLQPRWRRRARHSGFIASPVVYRSAEGRLLVAAVEFEARVLVVDAETGTSVWARAFDGLETEASVAVGRFGGDGTPDLVSVAAEGHMPVYRGKAHVLWLDGASGAVLARRAVPGVAVSTPVVFDLDGDALDETLVVANDRFDQMTGRATAYLFDGRSHRLLWRRPLRRFAAATPLLIRSGAQWHLLLAAQQRAELWRFTGPVDPQWPAFRGARGDGLHRSVWAEAGAKQTGQGEPSGEEEQGVNGEGRQLDPAEQARQRTTPTVEIGGSTGDEERRGDETKRSQEQHAP